MPRFAKEETAWQTPGRDIHKLRVPKDVIHRVLGGQIAGFFADYNG